MIFGTLIRIDFAFFPLLRGVTVEDIVCSLVQEVEIVVKSRTNKTSRNVVQRRWKPPEEVEDIDGREGFRLRKFLPIPRSLNQCLQTANVPGIRSKHYLGFRIRVVDPTEDTKEVICMNRSFSYSGRTLIENSCISNFMSTYSYLLIFLLTTTII